ncbi:MAG: DUF3445 domain-containing protein [Gammaproteobacteria bacterium]|nr:DUF3445 domain-containing protein [Gammaproteobacteria bacterium]
MKLNSKVYPIYCPEANQQSVLRLGLSRLSLADWILIDEDFELFHQHKLQQQSLNHRSVYQELCGAKDAIAEFNDFLLKHLLTRHHEQFAINQNQLIHLATGIGFDLSATSLWKSSLWVQDDLCLLQPQAEEYRLTVGSVCSPSRWRLQEKIGKSIDWIHVPVPDYQQTLSERVNRLLAGMKPGNPVQRYNWSIQPGNELNWQRRESMDSESLRWHWRVERQTLLKLPRTGAVMFCIRIFLHSFDRMEETIKLLSGNSDSQGFRKVLLAIINRTPSPIRHYKGLTDTLIRELEK